MFHFLAIFLFGGQLFGQPQFKRYDTSAGLSNNIVYDVYQDSDGFLWVATENGLNRYDGNSFEHFWNISSDSTTISHNIVKTVVEDQRDQLWVVTWSGLNRKRAKSTNFQRFSKIPGYQANELELIDITTDGKGNFWFNVSKDIIRFNPETESFGLFISDSNDPKKLLETTFHRVLADQDGTIWVYNSESDFISKLDENEQAFSRFELPYNLQFFYAANTNTIWTNSPEEFPSSFYGVKSAPELPDNITIQHSYEDDLGRLWVGTNSGLYLFSPGSNDFEKINFNNDLTGALSDFVQKILIDSWGGIWIATRNGLYHHDPLQFTFSHLDVASSGVTGSSSIVMALEETQEGKWIGTLGGGLHLYNSSKNTTEPIYINPEIIGTGQIWDILEYPELSRNLWLANTEGLAKFSIPSKKTSRFNLPLSSTGSPILFSLVPHEKNSFWVVGDEDIYLFDYKLEKVINRINFDETFRITTIQDVHLYKDSILFIATQGGGFLSYDIKHDTLVSDLFDSEYTSLTPPLFGISIWDIYEDSNGMFWLATSNGLYRFDAELNQIIRISDEERVSQPIMFSIIQDENGYLWIGTDQGLFSFKIDTYEFKNYSSQRGVLNDEFNRRATLRDSEGLLFFGGIQGITFFNPTEIQFNKMNPPVYITSFTTFDDQANENTLSPLDSVATLSWKNNTVEIGFTAINYTNPENNRYRYKLSGIEEKWVETGNRRSVRYTKIPPGEYQFQVQASNGDNNWNTNGDAISIAISPPFWRTYWAYLAYIILFGISLIVFVKLRTRNLEAERKRLESMVDNRTAELKAQKEKIEHQAEQLKELDEIKSRFFANISHELRTPLTLIQAPVQELMRNWHQMESVQTINAKLQLIEQNSVRLKKLIEELLDLSRLKQNTLEIRKAPLNMRAWVKLFLEPYYSLASSKNLFYRVEKNLPENLILNVDSEKLEKIASNLIINALKFTPENGRISVDVRYENQTLHFSVADSGPGINPEEQERIFERFYQSKNNNSNSEGLGLGLALSKELAEAMNGTLEVENAKNEGLVFTLKLPADRTFATIHYKEEEKNTAKIPSLIHTETPEPELTALIVEDNLEMRSYISELLENKFKIHQAENGKQAIKMLVAVTPDLILTDVMMPEMDGFEMTEKLREPQSSDHTHIPILMLTARAGSEDRIKGLRLGVDDYLVKPFVPEELKTRALNLAVNHRNRLSWIEDRREQELKEEIPEAHELSEIQVLVEKHLQNTELSIQNIANELHISERQLYRKIKALTGMTPIEYINSLRLDKARGLLRTSKHLTIDAIAKEVGFKSRSYFSKLFKESYGVPPSQYLK